MDEMSVEKWWNEICGRGKREKPREKPTQTRFVHHETHVEEPRRELGNPSGGRRASNRLRHEAAYYYLNYFLLSQLTRSFGHPEHLSCLLSNTQQPL